MKVFLDYGHGGNDPGAIGQGLLEKERTLTIGKRVLYHLKRHGVTVIESRSIDINPSLLERSNKANNNNVDVSVSLHCNAFNGSAKGIETYTYRTGVNEIKLAKCVHDSIIKDGLYKANRGIKQANFHMLRETKMAAILVEIAFIDNIEDSKLLKEKAEEFAVAISKGILSYFNQKYKDEVKVPQSATYFRVIAGSYTDRANAEFQQKKLKEKGFDSFLEAYKK